MKNLKNDNELSWSSVVANNAMNRKRVASGVNSYEKDIKINIESYLKGIENEQEVRWVDLCCGEGNALLEVANILKKEVNSYRYKLEGIDLVGYFNPSVFEAKDILEVSETNLSDWKTDLKYDLITIVHGLHYTGDKLKLIRYAASRLKNDGMLLANLDIKDIEITNEVDSKKAIQKYFRKENIDYNLRTKLLSIEGNKNMQDDFIYLGADDKAGANYTGQDVVKSYYKKRK
ncbi:methyltransferase domain-containing protein [Bernardetia sp. ABR2-2B]|uniref:methyltransferase domain-containing protein n=1 Tax=Bernardetia sp. ABR2-2B TaxID=3127472 RepID=UPI0030D0E2D6